MQEDFDSQMMDRALSLACEAAAIGEVPVGAVIVRNGEILSEAFNRRESNKNALAHAEILAIDEACKKRGGWRLSDCDLYVTLEPCPMCAGAIVNARIRRVIVAARDVKAGALGSLLNLNFYPLNHHPDVIFGVREEKAARLLGDFFGALRKRPKN